jgi:hypothetical protein
MKDIQTPEEKSKFNTPVISNPDIYQKLGNQFIPTEKAKDLATLSEQEKSTRSNKEVYTYDREVVNKLGDAYKPNFDDAQTIYDKYGKILQQENDAKAEQQSWAGNSLRFIGNALNSFAHGVLETPGYVGAIVEAGLTDKTIGETTQNAWINFFEESKKYLGEGVLKSYVPTDVQDGSIYDKLTSGSYLSSTGADVFGQMAALIAPGQLFKMAKIGSSLTKVSQATKFVKPEYMKNFLRGADDISAAAFNASVESAMEAKESFNNIYSQLESKIASGEMTEEEAKKIAGEHSSKVFQANMLMLFVPNLIDQKWLGMGFRGSSVTEKAMNKALAGAATPTARKWYQAIPSAAYGFGKGFFKEGGEEGMQYATQKYYEGKALGDEITDNPITGILGTFWESMDDPEFQEAVALGGILGGGMGSFGNHKQKKFEREMLYGKKDYKPSAVAKFFGRETEKESKGLVAFLNDNFIQHYDKTDIYKKDADGNVEFKNGKAIVDPIKKAQVLEAFFTDDKIRFAIQSARERGNENMFNLLKDRAIFNFMKPYMNIEGGVKVWESHLEEIVEREFKQRTEVFDESITKGQVKSELTAKFNEFNRQYQSFNNGLKYTNKLSKEARKENPFFDSLLVSYQMDNFLTQKHVRSTIDNLDLEITQLESSPIPANKELAKGIKSEKTKLEKLLTELTEKETKLYSKEGQETILNAYKDAAKVSGENVTNIENEESIKEDASQIEYPDYSNIYAKTTVHQDGKNYHGGIKVQLEDESEHTFDIVGINKGTLRVKDKEGKTFDLSTHYKGQEIKGSKVAYQGKVKEATTEETLDTRSIAERQAEIEKLRRRAIKQKELENVFNSVINLNEISSLTRVKYKGMEGFITKHAEEDVYQFTEIDSNRQYDIARDSEFDYSGKLYDYGIYELPKENPISDLIDIKETDNGLSITIDGKTYFNRYSNPLAAINRDKEGNIISINLETQDGKKRTFKKFAEEITYSILLYTYNQLENENKQTREATKSRLTEKTTKTDTERKESITSERDSEESKKIEEAIANLEKGIKESRAEFEKQVEKINAEHNVETITITSISTDENDNPEEVYTEKNASTRAEMEAEPHAPFTASVSDFFRTKGNQEEYQKDPNKYKPVLEFYNFINNYSPDTREESVDYRYLKAYTTVTIPKEITNKLPQSLWKEIRDKYKGSIMLFVMNGDTPAVQNGTLMFSYMMEPLMNGNIEPIERAKYPLFSYKIQREEGLTDEQITYEVQKAAESFTEIRDAIITSPIPVDFRITNRNRGKLVKEKNTVPSSFVGKIINTKEEFKNVELVISNDSKDRGMTYVVHQGVKVPIQRNQLSEADIKNVVGLMKYYVQQTDTINKEKAHRAISSYVHFVRQSMGKTSTSQFTFYPIEVKNEITGFQYGEFKITNEELLEGKTEHLENNFLNKKFYSVDKPMLNEANNGLDFYAYSFNEKENELDEKLYKASEGGYKKFLLEGDNPRIKVTLIPLGETQFLNRSFNIEPSKNIIKPMTKEEIKEVIEDSKVEITNTDEFTGNDFAPGENPEENYSSPDELFKPYNPSDIIGSSIEEMKWFRKTFKGFDTKFIPNGLINGIGVAAVTSNMELLVSEYITLGAMYHEGFHVVSQFFTTPATRKRLYNEVRQRTGNAEMTDIQAEEFLADEFQDFMQNPTSYKFNKGEETKQNIFQRLWSALKALFGVDAVEQMFDKIAGGEYNKEEALNKPSDFKYLYKIGDLNSVQSKKLVEHYNVLFFDRLLYTEGFKAETLLDLTPEKLNAVYKNLNTALENSKIAANRQVLFHLNDVVEQHKKFIKQYGFSLTEIEESQRVTKDNTQYVESITRSVFEDMPSPIKMLIGSLAQRNSDGTIIKDAGGFLKLVNFDATINLLSRELSNTPEVKFWSKLKEISIKYPELGFKGGLLSRLGINEDLTVSTSISNAQESLQSQFFVQFSKNMNNILSGVLTRDKKTTIISATQTSKENQIIQEWKANTKAGTSPYFELKEGKTHLIKDSKFTLPSGKQVEITKVHLEGNLETIFPKSRIGFLQDYLEVFGISVTDNVDYDTAITAARFLSENLDKKEGEITADDIFDKDVSKINKELMKLAEEELKFTRRNISNKITNGKGTTEYTLGLNNRASNLITELNNTGSEPHKDFIPYSEVNPEGNLLVANSNWNLEKLKLNLLRSVKPDFQDAIDVDETKEGDFDTLEFNAVLSGVMPFLRAADRSLEYGFNISISERDFSINQTQMVSSLKFYLENEIIVALAYQNDNNAKVLVKSGKISSDLQMFKDILPKLDITAKATKKDYKSVASKIMEDNRDYINTQLKKFVEAKIEENKKILTDFKLIEETGSTFTNHSIAQDIMSKFNKGNVSLNEDIVNQVARTFTHLYTTNAIEQIKYLMGNPASYKKGKTDSFFKRTTTIVSTKKNTRNDAAFIERLNINEPRTDGKKHSENRQEFVYDNNSVTSYLKDTLSKLGIKAYEKQMDENDAQGWSSLDGYKRMLISSDRWSVGKEKTYQYETQSFVYNNIYNNPEVLKKAKLSKERIDEIFSKHLPEGWKGVPQYLGKPIKIEEMESLTAEKPQGVGQIQNSNLKTFGVVDITKTSIHPLLPSNHRNTTGKQLIIDMYINGIDFVYPETAKKGEIIGNREGELPQLYKENGELNTISELLTQGHSITQVSWSDFGIQLDIDSSGKNKVTQSTQMEVAKYLNIFNKGEVNPGYEDLVPVVKNDIDLKALKKEKLLKNLVNELGLKKIDNNYTLENPTKFKATLESEFTRKTYSENILQGINLVIDSPLKIFDALNVSDKVDNLLTSIISNRLIKQKTKGDMLVQVASTLYETSLRNPAVSNSDTLRSYEPITNEDGDIISVRPAECMINLPKSWVKLVEKLEGKTFEDKLEAFNKDILKSRWDKLLTVTSNRIPTQDLNSMEAMRVVRFLTPWSGSTIIVPSEIVIKAGSDFDIDKLTEYLNTTKFDKEGNPLYLDEGTLEERYIQYIKESFLNIDIALIPEGKDLSSYEEKLNEITDRLLENGSYKDLTKEQLQTILNEEKSIAFEDLALEFNFLSFDKFSKLPLNAQLSISQIDNMINQNSIKLILHPKNYISLMSPNGAAKITKVIDSISPARKETNLSEIISYANNRKYGFAQWKAKAVLGSAANSVTFHAKTQLAPIRLNQSLIKIHFPEADNSFGSIYNSEGTLISQDNSEAVSLTVDAAKESEPALIRGNYTPSTSNVVTMLRLLGVDSKKIYSFTTSSIIMEYEKEREINESKFLEVQDVAVKTTARIESLTGYKYPEQSNMLHGVLRGILENDPKYTQEQLNERWNKIMEESGKNKTLELFLYYTEIGKYFGELVQLTKHDAGMPKNRDTVEYREERLQKLMKLGLFNAQDIQSLFDETPLGGFRNMQLEGSSMFNSFFLKTSDDKFAQFIYSMMQPYKDAKVSEDRLISVQRKLIKKSIAYLLHNTDQGKLMERYKELLIGKNNLAHKVYNLKNSTNEVKDNLFIKELIPIISEYIDRRKTNLEFDYLKRFSSKLTPYEEDDLNQSFRELIEHEDIKVRELASDIVYASIIQSGLSKSNSSFFDTIPTEYFYPIAAKAIEEFQASDFNYLNAEAIETLMQNSWSDKDIVKRQQAFVKGNLILINENKNLQLPLYFRNVKYPYLAVEVGNKDKKEGKEILLFKRGEIFESENHPDSTGKNTFLYLYNQIDKKGDSTKFFEATSPLVPSILTSNNVGKVEATNENVDQGNNEEVDEEFENFIDASYTESQEKEISLLITEEQLSNINSNLTSAGFREITMEEFNNMSPEKAQKIIDCYA